jgi:hypothetical protein
MGTRRFRVKGAMMNRKFTIPGACVLNTKDSGTGAQIVYMSTGGNKGTRLCAQTTQQPSTMTKNKGEEGLTRYLRARKVLHK